MAGFSPLTDIPGIYGRWRAVDYDSTNQIIPNSAGTAPLDTTRDMELALGSGQWTTPDHNLSDPDFNNCASIGSTSVAGGRTVGFRNRGNVNFLTSITGACVTYASYWIVSPPSPSTCYLRSTRTIGTQSGSPGLFYFNVYNASRNGSNNVTGSSTGTGLRIICNVYNSTSSATYVNSNTALATGNVGTTTITSLGLGNPASQAALWRMGALFLYTGTHTATQRNNMMAYLASLYNITLV